MTLTKAYSKAEMVSKNSGCLIVVYENMNSKGNFEVCTLQQYQDEIEDKTKINIYYEFNKGVPVWTR